MRGNPSFAIAAWAAAVLAAAGQGFCQDRSMSHEITGSGVTVRWTLPAGGDGGTAGFLFSASDSQGRQVAQESLPASSRSIFLDVWLGEGEEIQARLFVRTPSSYSDSGLSASIKGPFSETALEADGSVSGADRTSCTVKAALKGGDGEIRIFSGPDLLGRIPSGAREARIEGLRPGTRYGFALVPFSSADGREQRGRRTMLPPFTTPPALEWVPCNGGSRISGGEEIQTGFVCPGAAFGDKDGNLLFPAPHAAMGGCMGRFNAKSRKWEICGVEGWTEDKSAPPRPAFDGLFTPKSFLEFRDPKGGLHAIVDCYTSSGKEILDIHGSIHHFRWTGSEWEQYCGGASFSRYDSRPLFNTWTGSGAGFGFAMNDKNQVGIAVHVSKSLSANGRLIAARIDFRDQKNVWSTFAEGKWAPHSYAPAFVPNPSPARELEDIDPRVACLDGKAMWLVLFRRTPKAGSEEPFWTALVYDDARTKWLAWTRPGWSEGADPARFLDADVEPRTAGLFRDGGGRVFLLGRSGNDLVRIEYSHKASRWEAPEVLARLTRPSKYRPDYKTAVSPQGELVIAYSEDGHSASVHGLGRVAASVNAVEVLGVGFAGSARIVLYADGSELKAVSDRPVPYEKTSPAQPLPRPEEKEPDPGVAEYEGSFLNYAQDPVLPEGERRPVGPSYGPQSSGHMAATPDGTVFAPRFTVCNVCIFPPGHPKDPAAFWGGFWDYFMFPMGVAVDHVRGKVYVSHRVTSGGCGGILGGSVEIWDLAEKDRCHWLSPGLSGKRRTENCKPGRIQDVFRWPCGMAADPARGFLYVANSLTCDVRKYDVSGPEPKRVGILGDGVLDFPRGVAVGQDGSVYVVDSRHHRICVFSAAGKLTSSFGGPGRAPGRFLYPWGIAADPVSGLIFVSDPQNCRVQAFEKDGKPAGWWNRFKARNLDGKPEGPKIPGMSSGPPGNHDETFGLCCDGLGHLFAGTGSYIARFRIAKTR